MYFNLPLLFRADVVSMAYIHFSGIRDTVKIEEGKGGTLESDAKHVTPIFD